MKKQVKYILGTGLLIGALTSVWFIFSLTSKPVLGEQVEIAAVTAAGILDGMTFSGELGPLDKPAYVKDTLVFKDGTFVSTECEKNCNYPARPYYTRQVGDKIEFISETRCPYKDAKIVWRGTVGNGNIEGTYTWTIARWYWTVNKDFRFSGTLAKQPPPIAGNQ